MGYKFITRSTNHHPYKCYGNAIVSPTDGATVQLGSDVWRGLNLWETGFNVSNINSANWLWYFNGPGDVNNSTMANMFVSTTNFYPKSNGALSNAVTWELLPKEIQDLWPDTDFLGNTIVKFGNFSAGAIYVAGNTNATADGVTVKAESLPARGAATVA
jgi:hypothetical protein